MKHIAKFVPIITISWQINELEKILTGPGKLSGVPRNGPLVFGRAFTPVAYLDNFSSDYNGPTYFKHSRGAKKQEKESLRG